MRANLNLGQSWATNSRILIEQPPPAFLGVGEAGEAEGMPGHGVVAGGNGFAELLFEGMDCFGNPQVGAGDKDRIHGGMIADLEDGAFDGVRGDPADEVVIIDIEGRHRRHFDSFLLEQTAHLQVQFEIGRGHV